MNISYKIQSYKTNSGKHKISFICQHCKSSFIDLDSFYYQADLNKKDLIESLKIFVDKINSDDKSLFKNKKTFHKLKSHLCNCNEKVIDFERIASEQRAKEILTLGMMSVQDK